MIESGTDGLHLRAHLGDVAVAYHQPGALAAETLVLPFTALQELEARTDEKIALDTVGAGKVRARWYEGVVPRARNFTCKDTDKPPEFPVVSESFAPMPAAFLKALDQARQTVGRDVVRYAMNRILLRGDTSEVIATDGRQLLLQSGFPLPWREDVQIPSLAVFGHRELARAGAIQIGRTAMHVCLRVGPWTFFLAIDREGRYPRIEEVIPRADRVRTVCRLGAEDADFVSRHLSRLNDPKGEDQSVVLDLNGRVVVRAKAKGQEQETEVVLKSSTVSGPAVCLTTDPRYLQRDVNLGLTEIRVVKPDVPVLAVGDNSRYVWMSRGKPESTPAGTKPPCPPVAASARKPIPAPERGPSPKIRWRMPAPQAVPASRTPVSEQQPTNGRSGLWGLLRSLFAPRGWLLRQRQHR